MIGSSSESGGKAANYVINVILMSTGFFGIFLAYNTTQVRGKPAEKTQAVVSRLMLLLATTFSGP
jgi:hypothetical protein